uniref:TetR/AcrR family transcriptional regulator n=1 Tax=Phenylobacterium glaciei TaxID=2803784 RepID=A0A974SAM7_9CAUL|nr:TetR/AcrR family transcriptional regulator [Phenylobacterium glaciei]
MPTPATETGPRGGDPGGDLRGHGSDSGGAGEGALTTNAIAERAGISIGTLYQYHADKRSILVAMALAENAKVREALIAAAGPEGFLGAPGDPRPDRHPG